MKVLTVATALSCSVDGNSTIIDLVGQDIPFEPGYTNLAFISLNGVADAVVTLQEGDVSDLSDAATVAQVDLTAAAATSGLRVISAPITKRYIRVNANEVTTGAGTVDVVLVGN